MDISKGTALKKKTLFEKIFSDNSYSWLAAICTGCIALLIAYCFEMIPFGDVTILRMDMYHQYCPLFAELYDRVTGLQSFLYSWQAGLGSSFIGNFYNYLSSPSAIFVLLFGHENVPEAIAAMIFSKSALASAAFTYYIKKTFGKADQASAAFGILYAMCGWFIAYYWDVMWVDAMVFFPFIILGIEKIIDSRRPAMYMAALFLTIFTNYYMGYMTCLFSVIYFLIYFFSKYDFGALDGKEYYWQDSATKRSVPFGEKIKHSVFLKSGFTFAGASIAAAALCAFALVPVYFILQTSYAVDDAFPENWNSYFTIFDFLANHLGSLEPTIRSSGDVVLPNIFSGVGTIMLVSLYLFTKAIPVKEKIANVALLGIMFASFNLNTISFIWHGFHYPSDLPYRFSFMYSFVLLVTAYKAFINIKEFTGRQILGTGVALIGFIVLVQELGSKNAEDIAIILSIVFAVTYTIVFNVARSGKYQQTAVAVLLLCCIVGEVVCCNTQHYDIDQTKTNFAGDYHDYKALQTRLDIEEEGEFYRSELTYNRARMDPAWYGYNGISTFTSMAYESLSKLEKSLGLAGNNVNSYTYYLQTPVYNAMHALKYVIDNDEKVTVETDYFTVSDSVGKFTAYKNNYSLPIAFSVKEDLAQWYTEGGDPFIVQGQWFELATGVSDVFERMEISDIAYYNVDEITSGLANGNMYFNKTTYGEDGEITFSLSVPETRHCYLYVYSNTFDSVQINNGDDATVTQSTDEPYIYDLGICEAGENVTVLIPIDDSHDYGSIEFQPYAMNDEAFIKGYNILNRNAISIDSFEDTSIKGTVTVPAASMIYTSIPYDEGWSVKLNGAKVAPENIIAAGEGFLCVKAEPGDYTIEFSFVPKGLYIGCAISAATAVILLVIFLIWKKKQKENQPEQAQAEELPVQADEDFTETQNPIEIELDEKIKNADDIFINDFKPEEKDQNSPENNE
ncbi:MAG: YfhO family protein [Clostridia bacterium]|nr:YfhO family protein [Clostridia bacterium]